MCPKKMVKGITMKIYTALVLSIFIVGIGPAVLTAEDLNSGEGKISAEDILANNVLLTMQLAKRDLPPEEKIEILGNALGWNFVSPQADEGQLDAITAATSRVCNQYLSVALLLDTLDPFFPPLSIVTSLYYLTAVLCFLGVI
jgi:hypothetical protein